MWQILVSACIFRRRICEKSDIFNVIEMAIMVIIVVIMRIIMVVLGII